MPTTLTFEYTHSDELPPGHDNEVRTPDALVEHVLEAHTDVGDAVLDVFAGYGTTLTVAERLGRVPYGLEYEDERVAHVRDRLDAPDHVRQGDVLTAPLSWMPPIDCCVTSPPFMERTNHRNPFENYDGGSSYEAYLDDVETAFRRLDSVLAADGTVVVDVANMKHEGRVTTLAWGVADRVAETFSFRGETVVNWTDPAESNTAANDRAGAFGYGYDHSYLLTFDVEK
ncbi:MAG: DNA methyltransferase [Halopenitus sp.]